MTLIEILEAAYLRKPPKNLVRATRAKRNSRLSLERLEDRCLLAGDVVLQWNELLLNAIRTDKTPPPPASRNMAIVHVAMYDAVNSIDGTYTPYLISKGGPKDASITAAAAQAAHDALAALYPQHKATFDAALQASLADVPDGAAENKGVAVGRSVANKVLLARRNDGADATVPYTPSTDPGDWQPTPPAFGAALFPQWPDVTPFAMTSAGQFRPTAPPALTSADYATDFSEVKDFGGDGITTPTIRTSEQTLIARFWADGAGTETPPGHWNTIAQNVAQAQGTTVVQNARLFALLNIALADAAIDAWDCKYIFDFWRPVTAIRAADTDGNDATSKDATWTPLLVTPAFPSYTSGHSTFSSAGAAVLASVFGTDEIAFTTGSDVLPGVTRTFTSFSAAAAEAGQSRIFGGIHFQFDNQAALSSGSALGNYVADTFLMPVAPLVAAAAGPISGADPSAASVDVALFLAFDITTQRDDSGLTTVAEGKLAPAEPERNESTLPPEPAPANTVVTRAARAPLLSDDDEAGADSDLLIDDDLLTLLALTSEP